MSRKFVAATGDYLRGDTLPTGHAAPPGSLSLWGRLDTLATSVFAYIGEFSGSPDYRVMIYYDHSIAKFAMALDDGLLGAHSIIAALPTPVIAGQVYHLCAVSAASNDHRIYVDGVQQGVSLTNQGVGIVGLWGLTVGCWMGNPASGPQALLDGAVGQLCSWPTGLSPSQVADLGAGRSPRSVEPNGLLHYDLNGQSPEKDGSGVGPNLTVYGAPTIISEISRMSRHRMLTPP